MKNTYLRIIFFLLFTVGLASAADIGKLLARTGDGKLVIIYPDGNQELISQDGGGAAFSPDGRYVAFVVWHARREQPQGAFIFDSKLLVMNLATHATTEILHPPAGTGIAFGQLAWAPDGNAIVYEQEVLVHDKNGISKTDDLILSPFPPERGPARNLGHWYQGFSFSPDGTRIVHAVNFPFGLEIVDIATGTRTLLHKANNVVWEAQFSPDGKFIAYTKTVGEPQQSAQAAGDDDDAPDCGSPDRELRIYSLADGSDTKVGISVAGDVYNFAWSPDSKKVALELGSEECDYPSDDAAVYVATVDQKFQKRISSASPSIQPAFSPNGSAVAFVDSSVFPNRLLRYDFSSGTTELIRRAGSQENGYQLLGWK